MCVQLAGTSELGVLGAPVHPTLSTGGNRRVLFMKLLGDYCLYVACVNVGSIVCIDIISIFCVQCFCSVLYYVTHLYT